jgi:hypothetical protein
MDPGGSLPFSQKAATGPYPETLKYGPYTSTLFLQIKK